MDIPKCYEDDTIIDFHETINKLDESIKNNDKIRIWSSHMDANSYVLLLFICNYVKDKIDTIYVTFSDEFLRGCPSPGNMTSREMEYLSTKEHELSREDILNFSLEWQKILKTKCDLRIMVNSKLKYVNFDYFDEFILSNLAKKSYFNCWLDG